MYVYKLRKYYLYLEVDIERFLWKTRRGLHAADINKLTSNL